MAKKEKKEPIYRIGAILAEQGVKKEVFAELVGVNSGTVSEWINHKGYPEASRLPKIAEVLNVNRQLLLIETQPKEGKSPAQIKTEEREKK
ncbi:hypothetical protein GCM10011386_02990 [Parapedobacter defluvii]|uniref:HTH cro/C1-type domain-containing protein n=1 Tax=Parapedobacter defluvii TaxID=2045106 RepID=A0ABQ1L1U8_9SPHI|nr:helix-turn-helix transcriptional regulator [Parapedobacter defluvii]GGC14660.1 hypothetical protein GCM10011386_02990 [Parapedobacter defluvii]